MQTLRLFADVARCHSFSQAAALHGITQSAASQRIGQLEKRLGITLLDRSVRPLGLTEAGHVFLQGCEDLLERYDRLEAKVANMQDDPGGIVRVVAIYSAGIELLNQIRERFEAEHPRISVDIRYEQPDGVYQAVREFECDLGILSYPQRWRKVGVLPLRDEPMAVVCRPSHALATHDQVHVSELSSYEMASFTRDLPVARHLHRYLKENGAAPKLSDTFDNIDTIKNVVMVTDRFSILPIRTVSREVEAGVLSVVSLIPTVARPLGVIFRRRHKQEAVFGPAAQVFVDYLLRHAGPGSETRSVTAESAALVGAGK